MVFFSFFFRVLGGTLGRGFLGMVFLGSLLKGNFHSVEEPLKSWLELAGKPGEPPFLGVGPLLLFLLPCLFLLPL